MRILVDAYLEKNLGDDLFLKILFDRYPSSIEWFVICDNINKLEAFQNYPNVKMFDKKNTSIKQFDAAVNIGGSIFMQNGRWWIRQLLHRLSYSFPLKMKKAPVFILGANYGPSDSKLMDFFNKLFIKYFVKDICFRDLSSYKKFQDLQQVRYGSDIVYSLNTSNYQKNKFDKNNRIGISIMFFKDTKIQNAYINTITKMTKRFIELGNSVEFFAFCESEGDIKSYDMIINNLENKYLNKICINTYTGDIENYLNRINNMDIFITLRFHSLILAQILKIKYYPIVYSMKTVNVLKDQNFNGKYTFIENIDEIDADYVLENLANYPIKSELRDKALLHFEELDKFIFNRM